eukprot:397589-Hanusia_phi.AAC.1
MTRTVSATTEEQKETAIVTVRRTRPVKLLSKVSDGLQAQCAVSDRVPGRPRGPGPAGRG